MSTKIDIGCGRNKRDGFIGLDIYPMEGVDKILDLREQWPFEDNSVDEANCSHFLEHLTNFNDKWERVKFFNELYRVLKPGGFCVITTPHWCSSRFYGDPTHKEPWGEMSFYYLDKTWRMSQAPHSDKSVNPNGYDCNFNWTYAYGMRQDLLNFHQEKQMFFLSNYKEAAQDLIATVTAKKD